MALVEQAQIASHCIKNPGWPRCFPGYETNKRYLVLRESGLKVLCVENGLLLDSTDLNDSCLSVFSQLAVQFSIQACQNNPSEWYYPVAQKNGIDTEDRIVRGAKILKAFIQGGL